VVHDAGSRIEQPAPHQRDDHPARHDRQEVGRPEDGQTAQPLVEGKRDHHPPDDHEGEIAGDIRDRMEDRAAEVGVAEESLEVVESDELRRPEQVPAEQAEPGGRDHGSDREEQERDEARGEEQGDHRAVLPAALTDDHVDATVGVANRSRTPSSTDRS
jgi:hypothetical protein